MRNKVGFMLVFALLLTGSFEMNWQAHGSAVGTKKNIDWSIVTTFVNTKMTAATSDNQMFASCKDLSDQLNTLYDPAWNVIAVRNFGSRQDSILYGYAFMDHWFWSNGNQYIKAATTFFLSVLVWKDYNCDPSDWSDINPQGLSPKLIASPLSDELDSYVNTIPAVFEDIWKTGDNFFTKMSDTYPKVKAIGRGFTLLLCQSQYLAYFARVCTKGFSYQKSFGPANNLLIIQMRN